MKAKLIKIPETEHSRFAPSAAERVRYCPASLKREEKIPNIVGIEAKQGTVLHHIAHDAIVNNKPSFKYENTFLLGKEKIKIDKKLLEKIKGYVNYAKLKLLNGNGMVGVEQKLESGILVKGQFGHCDMLALVGSTLEIHDLKTGRVTVYAFNNTQLMVYSVLALGKLPHAQQKRVNTIKLFVHQYPALRPRVHEYTINEINAFTGEMVDAYKKALSKNPIAIPGEHCIYCRAKPTCNEYKKYNTSELVKLGIMVKIENLSLADYENIFTKKRAILELLDIAEDRIRVSIAAGKKSKFKLEPGRFKQTWKNEKEALTRLRELGYSVKDITKIISPAEFRNVFENDKEVDKLIRYIHGAKVLKKVMGNEIDFDEYPALEN